MTTDIERVARAICCAEGHEVCNEDIGVERDRLPMPCNWVLYREQATAAILATLRAVREPSEEMCKAQYWQHGLNFGMPEADIAELWEGDKANFPGKDLWQAMIDTLIAQIEADT